MSTPSCPEGSNGRRRARPLPRRAVRPSCCRAWPTSSPPDGPAALMAVGLVVENLYADHGAARAAFGERFDEFASPEQRELVRSNFPRLDSGSSGLAAANWLVVGHVRAYAGTGLAGGSSLSRFAAATRATSAGIRRLSLSGPQQRRVGSRQAEGRGVHQGGAGSRSAATSTRRARHRGRRGAPGARPSASCVSRGPRRRAVGSSSRTPSTWGAPRGRIGPVAHPCLDAEPALESLDERWFGPWCFTGTSATPKLWPSSPVSSSG